MHIHNTNKLITALAIAGFVTLTGCGGSEAPVQSDTTSAISTHGSIEVEWAEDLQGALERAKAEGKPVLVNFYADWCVWCKRLESTTFRDDQVKTMLRDRVVPLSLNVEGDGRELSDTYRVDGLPTILVLDGSGREIGRIPGYMAPTGFLETVDGIIQQS